MEKPKKIDQWDKIIFKELARAQRPLSVSRISKEAGLSWATVNEHTKKMEKLKIVKIEKSIRRSYVTLTENFIKKINKRRELK